MEIDWDTPATLDSFSIINDPRPAPPAVNSTLRACLEAVQKWPMETIPTIHTDRPVSGKTVFNREEISVLIALMPKQ